MSRTFAQTCLIELWCGTHWSCKKHFHYTCQERGLETLEVEGHHRRIQEEINRHGAPNPQSWVAPTMKNEVQTCHPHPSISFTSKVSRRDPRWKFSLRQLCRNEVEKRIVLLVLSLAGCYNECKYVQSASRLHITANLKCLRWVVTPRMPTTPLKLRYIRVQVLHLLLCFTHICHLLRRFFSHTTLSQTILSRSFTYNILPRNFVTQLFDIHFFLYNLFETTDPPASCLSFLPSPHCFNHCFWLLEEVDFWGYPVLLISGYICRDPRGLKHACTWCFLHMLPSMHCCVTWWQGPSRASQQTSSHGSWGTHCFWKGKRTNIGRWEASGRICQLIEGSLEVKLPTIWTDEKQSKEEAERRERLEERRVEEKESEERRCRCAKR